MAKMVPQIILEGTRLTFETEIAFELNEHPRIVGPRRYRYHSPLISAEWCSFTNVPWGRGPINFEPCEEGLAMETYAARARLFRLQRYYSWIVERFHVSTRVFQRTARSRDLDFGWLEERLAPLGFVIVFLRRSPESFAAAREERLKVSGKPDQYDDLQPFLDEQAIFEEVLETSLLPVLKLDLTDNDVAAAVERIADWMEATGKLYLDG